MAILDELRDLMADSVSIAPRTAKDVHDKATYGTDVAYTCRVEGTIMHVKDPNGNERVSSVQVYLDRLPSSITVRDRITLPARFVPNQPPIINIAPHVDEDGTSGDMAHSIIYC